MPPLGGATRWLNAEPLRPAELRRRVLVNFWTLTCINWLRQEPYVRAWSRVYRDDGLVVIGVHTPEFSFEHEIDGVRQATEERAIDYPVAVDNDYAVWAPSTTTIGRALFRREGRDHSRRALRRRPLRTIRPHDPTVARRRAGPRRRRRSWRQGGGRLGQPAHARDVSRIRARRALRFSRRHFIRRTYELTERLGSHNWGCYSTARPWPVTRRRHRCGRERRAPGRPPLPARAARRCGPRTDARDHVSQPGAEAYAFTFG
jgi:SAM-dependent methyltransferase